MKKSERLNQELFYLNNKRRFHLEDLTSEFNISKRTALRDLDELSEIGLPYYTDAGRYGGYTLLNQTLLPPVTFSVQEVQAIFFALSGMKGLSSNPFEKSFPQIQKKLWETLPKKQRQGIDSMASAVYFYSTAPVKSVASLDIVMQSILNEQALSITDTQHVVRKSIIQVFELFYRNGIWFCSAVDLATHEWGTYRCDKLTEISLYDGQVELFSNAELRQLQDKYEATYHNIQFRCVVNKAGRDHFLRDHYPNMRLVEENDKTYVCGGYNIAEETYMVEYLLSYGKNMKIEYPESLAIQYRNYLTEMLNAKAEHQDIKY